MFAKRLFSVFASILMLALVVHRPCFAQSATLIPFHATGWRYAFFTGALPTGWMNPGFNDSSWSPCSAPLSGDSCVTSTIAWPVGSRVVMRFHFASSGQPSSATITYLVEGSVQSYINGQQLTQSTSSGCPVPNYPNPNGAAVILAGQIHAGDNVFVFYSANAPPVFPGALDVQVTAEGVSGGPTGTRAQSFGALKAKYR
jgi:hypothetical protein